MGLAKVKGILSVWKGRIVPKNTVPWQDHWTARTYMIAANLRWVGPQSLILVGDSNLEMIPPHALEGLDAINAGFGGARAEHVLASIRSPMVSAALKANRPAKAVIQVGTNDSLPGTNPLPVAEFAMSIARYFEGMGTKPIIFAIPPIEERKTAFRSAVAADAINEATRKAALASNTSYSDPYASIRANDDVTEDGIHLARNAIIALVSAIRAA